MGQATVDGDRRFSFSKADVERPELLCSVRAKTGDASATAVVKGRDKACAKVPVCKILSPIGSLQVPFDTDVSFKARASLKDPLAKPLRLEWDFAGGTMGEAQKSTAEPRYRKANRVTAKVRFIRDNTRYRVRFTAWDNKQRYCEDSVEVTVGNPPDNLTAFQATTATVEALANQSQDAAPPLASALKAESNSLVVLPFEDWTMQSATDSKFAGPLYMAMRPQLNSLTAQVYRKTRLPELVDDSQIGLKYQAASNPADPVGPRSINTTSRNWPVEASLAKAELQKGDLFETWVSTLSPEIPAEQLPVNQSFIDSRGYVLFSQPLPTGQGGPDAGYALLNTEVPDSASLRSEMPGILAPFQNNDLKPIAVFSLAENRFKARGLPITDIDDQGQVNPFPAFRIAAQSAEGSPLAATDAVLTASRDLHCRECHVKGGIGANTANHWAGQFIEGHETGGSHGEQPSFYSPANDSLAEQEFAAQLNLVTLHDFYDVVHFQVADRDYRDIASPGCDQCHHTIYLDSPIPAYRVPLPGITDPNKRATGTDDREGGRAYRFPMQDNSAVTHAFHGMLTYNESGDDILRWPSGRFRRWNPELDNGTNPRPLFPVADKAGKPLPMEDNCLKCHGGMREQAYRDRHYTAGITCYQCHGDMLAMGTLAPKSHLHGDGLDYRIPWLEEPDCGACHTGSANHGRTRAQGYFSAGVREFAFDVGDPTATPLQPNPQDPDQTRFGAQTVEIQPANPAFKTPRLAKPSFRLGKDSHGNIACAACHGASHALWPNRDPNANDNLTALQLQGYPGTILECSVCHTADAFNNLEDLDGGKYMLNVAGITDYYGGSGVLGGPHNTHPINDSNWWLKAAGTARSAADDTGNSGAEGGWHNDIAKRPGLRGEDQCAACHGNDHKGSRLSRTPVARVFDFSSLDPARRKSAGIKKTVVKLAAQAVIGCNTCHTIKTSCIGSPNPNCGTSKGTAKVPDNRPPSFTSEPVTTVTKGELYRYTATATDPDGDPVTLRITGNPTPAGTVDGQFVGQLQLNDATGLITADWVTEDKAVIQATKWTYILTADDGRGGITNQTVIVNFDCPGGLFAQGNECVSLRITSEPPVRGFDAGTTFSYRITAEQAQGLPLTFTLGEGAPEGMSLDSTGLLTWNTAGIIDETVGVADISVADSAGNITTQPIVLLVCAGSQRYDSAKGCVGPITVTSFPPSEPHTHGAGLNVNDTYRYPVTATHRQNLPLAYALSDAPAGMTVSNDGIVEWTADASSTGLYSAVLTISDGQGGRTRQTLILTVCSSSQRWNAYRGSCVDQILIDSTQPVFGIDEGQTFTYPVTAVDENPAGLPLVFSLQDAPAGMNINAETGVLTWIASAAAAIDGQLSFTIVATDQLAMQGAQQVFLTVCSGSQHWDSSTFTCQ